MLKGICIAIGVLGVMICTLTIFKLTGFVGMGIDLSWWWVFSPIWMPLYMIIGACMVVASLFFLAFLMVGVGVLVLGVGVLVVGVGCIILFLLVMVIAGVIDYLTDGMWL